MKPALSCPVMSCHARVDNVIILRGNIFRRQDKMQSAADRRWVRVRVRVRVRLYAKRGCMI